MSLRCNFILFFLVANELWIKAKVQEQNKTWNFPRLARRFIWRRVIDRLDNKGYVSVSWLPVCWEETVRYTTSKSSTFWIVCWELIFIQMSIHSKRKLWLHLMLFEERGGWLWSRMQEIISRWHSKVRTISLQRFYRTTKIIWLKLYRFTLSVINLLLSKFVDLLTIHWCKRRKSSAKTPSSVLSQTKSNSWSAQRFINKKLGSLTLTKWSE